MKTNDTDISALITDIQRFCMHDGPGIRTTVFFKGCPLRCAWCHNPETQNPHSEIMFTPSQCVSCGACEKVCGFSAQKMLPERTFDRNLCRSCGKCSEACPTGALTVSGKKMTVEEIMKEVEKDRDFYGDIGGLTVSGGEPTVQPEALFALLRAAKNSGFSTAIETCGVFSEHIVKTLSGLTDTFLYDIKDTDPARLKENTGADFSKIVSNLHTLDDMGSASVLRCIIIPDVNMNAEHSRNLACLYKSLSNCRYVELLPYHPFGASKSERLGLSAPRIYRKPEKDELLRFASSLTDAGVTVKCYGTELK